MDTDFSAKAPSLGYYFQIRYGLHLLLNHEGSDESKLFFECLDDIEISELDQLNLYQTKFHIKNNVNLTDRSTDLWKTIRVWSESIKKGIVKLKESSFYERDFGILLKNKVFTYQDIDSTWVNYKIEDLYSQNDRDKVMKSIKPNFTAFSKDLFHQEIQNLMAEKKDLGFEDYTKEKFKKVIEFLK